MTTKALKLAEYSPGFGITKSRQYFRHGILVFNLKINR